jgi:hypothetical protein
VGTVLQDFREGRRGTFLDLGSALSPAGGGGSPAPLSLAPDLILQTPELRLAQFGQPPDDLLYHPPPTPVEYADTMILHKGASRRDPVPLDTQHGAG